MLEFTWTLYYPAGELDDKMKWLKNFDRLLEIQRSIVWPSVLELDPKQYFPEFLKVKVNVDTIFLLFCLRINH